MSKYKFSLNPRIKGIVEWQLEHYREDRRQLEDAKQALMPSPTAGYGSAAGATSGGRAQRPTESAALHLATNRYIRQLEQSCAAIERVLSHCHEIDMKLIDLVYWKREYTVEGAGMKLNLSRSSAYQRINSILGAIAVEIGYVNF